MEQVYELVSLQQFVILPGFLCFEADLTQRKALAVLQGTWALFQVAT